MKVRRRWAWFTLGEVAEATGLAPRTVARHAREGVLDRSDVVSVARYVLGSLGRDVERDAAVREAYLRLGVELGIGLPGNSSVVTSGRGRALDPDAVVK